VVAVLVALKPDVRYHVDILNACSGLSGYVKTYNIIVTSK